MIPSSIKIPMPNDYVFPHRALFLSVDKVVNFDRLREDDNQDRDENGVRLWVVKVSDLDPDAGKFGRSNEVKVKIAAEHQPVPPDGITLPGGITVRPVAFVGLTATPYNDSTGCKGGKTPHKCRARQAWSLRATAMVEPDSALLDNNQAAA